MDLTDLPPSAKLVLKVLEYEGSQTQEDLVDETRLPQRTVRDALDRLAEEGIVVERPYYRDARKSLYALDAEVEASDGDEAAEEAPLSTTE